MGNEELLSETLKRMISMAEKQAENAAIMDKLVYEMRTISKTVDRAHEAIDKVAEEELKPLRLALFGNGNVDNAVVTRVGRLENKCLEFSEDIKKKDDKAKSRSRFITGIISSLIVLVLGKATVDYMDKADRGAEVDGD